MKTIYNLICWGPKGCYYKGLRKEFRSGIPQRPLKCPKCGKTYTFKGEVEKEILGE